MKDSFFIRSRRDLNPRAGFCRPTPLAGAPLQPLEYYSSPESSFHMYETHNELYRRGYRLSNLCIFLYLCGLDGVLRGAAAGFCDRAAVASSQTWLSSGAAPLQSAVVELLRPCRRLARLLVRRRCGAAAVVVPAAASRS